MIRYLKDYNSDLTEITEQSNEWLCCNEFTIADISLGVLLHRLSILGLESHFWSTDSKPYLTKYYRQITQRNSFKKSLPSMQSTMKIIWEKLPQYYKVYTIGIAAFIACVTVKVTRK